jgi:hypothetical protein
VTTVEAPFTVPGCAECTDLWTWAVVYSDGVRFLECRGEGQRHAAYADIDLDRVQAMALLPMREGLSQYVVKMTSPDMRPVFFRRRYVEVNVGAESVVGRQTIHCLGYQFATPGGCKVEHYTFVFEDGSTLLTNDRQAV